MNPRWITSTRRLVAVAVSRLVRLLVVSFTSRDFDYYHDERYSQPYPNSYEKLAASLLVPILAGLTSGIITALALF